MDTADLRKSAIAVYLATEAGTAEDLSKRLQWAADEIDRLTAWVKRMEHQISVALTVHRLQLRSDPEGNYSIGSDPELVG